MNSSVYPVIRPYYRIAKFGERVEGYSSLVSREIKAGMERVRLKVSADTLSTIATEEHHRPGSLLKAITYLYPLLPPLDPRDILPSSIRLERDGNMRIIEFVVRRGHHILAELLRATDLSNHEVTLKDGKILVDGEQVDYFSWTCLPDYSIEEEEQERHVPTL